jgi:TonB family protein
MEFVMHHRPISSKIFLLPAFLLSFAVVSTAHANWFFSPQTGLTRNVGSAPNPTPLAMRSIRPDTDYPRASQILNEQGKVGLKIMLTDQGTMTDVVVEQSSGYPRLDAAAVRYMKTRWQYQPAGKDKPMPASVQVAVTFRLQ